jgi:arachidonate 15-lipoxygenase
MKPCLPQHEPDAAQRSADLDAARKVYAYTYDACTTLPLLAHEVPDQDRFSTRYIAERLAATAELPVNLLTARVRSVFDPLDELSEYEELFPVMPLPSVAKIYQTDHSFAEQRLSGVNPLMIRLLKADDPRAQVLHRIPSASAEFEMMFNVAHELQSGNIYITDYTGADDSYAGAVLVEGGEHDKGRKYLPKVRAFFRWRQCGLGAKGELTPIAIQLGKELEGAVHTPFSPPNQWLFAKFCVQVADANHHEMSTHLCRTHFAMEPFAIATARQLAASHPLNLLLRPHFRFMLANNDLGRKRLINKSGPVDDLMAGTLDESMALVAESYANWSIDQFAFPTDIRNRGMEDRDRLPHYPYRDDGMLIWEALYQFVTGYLQSFYPDSQALLADVELQGWAKELVADRAEGGASIAGMPATIDNLEKLVEIITTIIFTCGPLHSAVNFSQYDYMAFPANMPLAAYLDPMILNQPNPEITAQTLLKLLPPYQKAAGQLQILFILSAYRFDQLGDYDKTYRDLYDAEFNQVFADTPVVGILEKFQQQLYRAEQRINERNKQRVIPYNSMNPSGMINSISI